MQISALMYKKLKQEYFSETLKAVLAQPSDLHIQTGSHPASRYLSMQEKLTLGA